MSKLLRLLAILVSLVLIGEGAPWNARKNNLVFDSQAMRFLENFGYLAETSTGIRNSQDPKAAIARYQRKAGLRPTGLLSKETLKQMARPRCGVPDENGNAKRFTIRNSSWKKRQLTYRISNYPTSGRISQYEVNRAIGGALQMWSEVTDFTFRVADPRFNERHDIEVRFERGAHGDRWPFDYQGGVLAHAFFPSIGKVHFDDSEIWSSYGGTSLFQVAVHEFGHILGLDHSENYQAVMTPVYSFRSNFRLHSDDIRGVQTLYPQRNSYRRRF